MPREKVSEARAKAQADWDARTVCHYIYNNPNPRDHIDYRMPNAARPASIAKSGFYDASSRDETFVEEYNKVILKLLTQHGRPEWAPLSRLPTEDVARFLLEKAIPFGEHQFPNLKEAQLCFRLVSLVLDFGFKPVKIFRCDPKRISILLGVRESEDRIDILDWDTEEKVWMKCYGPSPWVENDAHYE